MAGLFVTCEILGWCFFGGGEDLGGLIQHCWGIRLNLCFVFRRLGNKMTLMIGEQTVKQSREMQLGEHVQEGGMQYGPYAYCGSRTLMRFKFISRISVALQRMRRLTNKA